MTHIEGVFSLKAPDPNSPAISLEGSTEGQNVPLIAGVDISGDIATALEDYTTTADLDTLLEDYELIADLESDYTTTTDLNTALDLKADVADYTTTVDLNTALDLKLDITDGLTLADNVALFQAQIADPSSATAEDCANAINALLTKLINAGLMAAS